MATSLLGQSGRRLSAFHAGLKSTKFPYRCGLRAIDQWSLDVFPTNSIRPYMATTLSKSEQASVASDAISEKEKKIALAEYGKRQMVYRHQVSQLRKQYAAEVAAQRAADEAEERARQARIRRETLERHRLRNIRTAQNALRQKERREQRTRDFEEELRVAQLNRDARNGRYNKARQMVIDEMEEQAHLWLTTPREVHAAFTHEASQLLWARRGGVLGAPRPTADSDYWRLECHTWHMTNTYPLKKELLLENIMDEIYEEVNVDRNFWTPERVAEQNELEEKAKLRAMVRLRGLSLLLQRRAQIYKKYYFPKPNDIPTEAPIPDLKVFTRDWAMEQEGVRDLFENPTAYFRFANDRPKEKMAIRPADVDAGDDEEVEKSYSGPTLGKAVGLKDWIRDEATGGTPYPLILGALPKKTAKSERERKRAERENRMRAAAEAKMSEAERQDAEIRAELEDDDEDNDFLADDEDAEPNYDEDELEWLASLDPVEDADLLALPVHARYTEEDFLWVIEKLEKESVNVDFMVRQAHETMVQQKKAAEAAKAFMPSRDDLLQQHGIDPKRVHKAVESLSDMQKNYLKNMGLKDTMSEDAIREAYRKVPDLSEEQYSELVELDLLYLQSKKNKIK